jgi:hypothetical protein
MGYRPRNDAKDSAIPREGDRRVEVMECVAHLGNLFVTGFLTPRDIELSQSFVHEHLRIE